MSKLLIIELLQSEDIAAPPSSVEKVMGIEEHIGCAMSGLIADARTLVLPFFATRYQHLLIAVMIVTPCISTCFVYLPSFY